MSYTERFSEVHQVLAHIPADSETTEINTGFVALTQVHRLAVIISVGDIAATGTFDVALQQATDTGGTGAKALAGKSTTQLTQAGGDSDDLLIIEVKSIELDVAGGFDCVNVRISPAVAATEFAVIVLGICQRFVAVATTLVTEIID